MTTTWLRLSDMCGHFVEFVTLQDHENPPLVDDFSHNSGYFPGLCWSPGGYLLLFGKLMGKIILFIRTICKLGIVLCNVSSEGTQRKKNGWNANPWCFGKQCFTTSFRFRDCRGIFHGTKHEQLQVLLSIFTCMRPFMFCYSGTRLIPDQMADPSELNAYFIDQYRRWAADITSGSVEGLEGLAQTVCNVLDDEIPRTVPLARGVYINDRSISDSWQTRLSGVGIAALTFLCGTGFCRHDVVKVEKRMDSLTKPWMISLSSQVNPRQPPKRLILKPEDMGREACVMEIIGRLNHLWKTNGLQVCGQTVYAKTYRIFPVGPDTGFVEVVMDSVTVEKLKRDSGSHSEESIRAERYLENDSTRLDILAATTVGYLACCYILGIGDGHGDNLMLTKHGELFRIDFGFLFGEKPSGPDAPSVWLPVTLQRALGHRISDVIDVSKHAVRLFLATPAHQRSALYRSEVFDTVFPSSQSATRYLENLSEGDYDRQVMSLGREHFGKMLKSLFRRVGYGVPVPRSNSQKLTINVLSPVALALCALQPLASVSSGCDELCRWKSNTIDSFRKYHQYSGNVMVPVPATLSLASLFDGNWKGGLRRVGVGAAEVAEVAEVDESWDGCDSKQKALKLDLGKLTYKHMGQLKKLITCSQILLPVKCKDQFYWDLTKYLEYCCLGFYADVIVGSICCRLEDRDDGGKALHIMMLSILKPYRRRSRASQLVQWILDRAQSKECREDDVRETYLHVQTSNKPVLQLFRDFGFRVTEKIEAPIDCYLLRCPVNGHDWPAGCTNCMLVDVECDQVVTHRDPRMETTSP